MGILSCFLSLRRLCDFYDLNLRCPSQAYIWSAFFLGSGLFGGEDGVIRWWELAGKIGN